MKVSMFVTCICDAMYPQVAEAIIKLLNRYQIKVDFPQGQTCCGQPSYNSGYWKEARAAALTLLDAFEDSDFVIAPSGSCVSMVHHYPKLFEHEPKHYERAKQLQAKCYEFTQFLVKVLGVTDIGALFPHTVNYHPSCHGTRLLGVKDEPTTLLKQVEGLELVPLPFAEDCCGFGGTFAIKMGDISGAMVSEKADHILESKAEVLVGIDLACLMNIGGHLVHRGKPVRVMHIAELLCEGVAAHESAS